MSDVTRVSRDERMRRWRMVLGGADDPDADGTGVSLDGADARIDAALGAIYDARSPQRRARGGGRSGGLGRSAPCNSSSSNQRCSRPSSRTCTSSPCSSS